MTTQDTDRVAEALDADFAEAWRPKPGEQVIGVVTAISEREGGFGKYPILTIQPDEGEPVAVHAFRTVLASKLAEASPKIAERLGVMYIGEVDGGERRYHSYRVAVDRPEQGVDWSTYSEDVAAQPAPSDVPGDTSGLESAAEAEAARRQERDENDAAASDEIPF